MPVGVVLIRIIVWQHTLKIRDTILWAWIMGYIHSRKPDEHKHLSSYSSWSQNQPTWPMHQAPTTWFSLPCWTVSSSCEPKESLSSQVALVRVFNHSNRRVINRNPLSLTCQTDILRVQSLDLKEEDWVGLCQRTSWRQVHWMTSHKEIMLNWSSLWTKQESSHQRNIY